MPMKTRNHDIPQRRAGEVGAQPRERATTMTDKERADILADDGYRYIEIEGKLYRADEVMWAMVTGEWPEGEIDHINGDRGDNRWVNLRVKRC
jgi:hypothetical protein